MKIYKMFGGLYPAEFNELNGKCRVFMREFSASETIPAGFQIVKYDLRRADEILRYVYDFFQGRWIKYDTSSLFDLESQTFLWADAE